MEDAHICMSELGMDNLSMFGVFDGHGGSEVAKFCKQVMPSEVSRQLVSSRDQGGSSGSAPIARSGPEYAKTLGNALIKSFNKMDTMLLEDANLDFLASLQQGHEGGGDLKSKAAALVSDSIQTQLSNARERGHFTLPEAQNVMAKATLLKRLETAEVPVNPPKNGAGHVGCTAVCILMSQNLIVCANAGDSRAIMCRKGKVVELSHDHKPNEEIELARINAAGGTVQAAPCGQRMLYRVNGNLSLSRSIGDLEYKKRADLPPEAQAITSTPDIITAELRKGDEFIVLACDGIWDVKCNEYVVKFVRKHIADGMPLQNIAEALLDDCITRDPKATHGLGADNMSCIIIALKQSALDDSNDGKGSMPRNKWKLLCGLCRKA